MYALNVQKLELKSLMIMESLLDISCIARYVLFMES